MIKLSLAAYQTVENRFSRKYKQPKRNKLFMELMGKAKLISTIERIPICTIFAEIEIIDVFLCLANIGVNKKPNNKLKPSTNENVAIVSF